MKMKVIVKRPDEEYDNLKPIIEDNYLRVQKYKNFEDWFMKRYGTWI